MTQDLLIKLITENKNIKNVFKSFKNSSNKVLNTTIPDGSSLTLALFGLIEQFDKIVLLLPDTKTINEVYVELKLIDLKCDIIKITDYSVDNIQEKLNNISKSKKFVLLASYRILLTKFPPKDAIEEYSSKIETGGKTSFNALISLLEGYNYRKDKFVEEKGVYSQRGSIVDFWSFSDSNPVRIEFDGDFIESLRYFNPENQRSIQKANEVYISGNIIDEADDEGVFSSDVFDYIDEALIVGSKFEIVNTDFSELEKKVEDNLIQFEENIDENAFLDEFPEPVLVSNTKKKSQSKKIDFEKMIGRNGTKWMLMHDLHSHEDIVDLKISQAPIINGNFDILFNTLKDYLKNGYEIMIAAENEIQRGRLSELISEKEDFFEQKIDAGKLKFITSPIRQGFFLKENKTLVLSDYQIFGKPYRTKVISDKKLKKARKNEFTAINPGDYVVHEEFGIAKYAGLANITIGEAVQESMKLLYDAGSVVYVNLNFLHLVKKYSSKEGTEPRLATLGTNTWANTKLKTKKKIRELAKDLIKLYAERKNSEGYAFSQDTIWQRELEASFIYEDTPDQAKVTEDVKKDMESRAPMDRLVCGDVGFGKTEIAVRAAFKAIMNSKQAAVLVPTTILAEQHYNTFKDRLSMFPVKVEVLSRFQSKANQTVIVNKLKKGEVDIVIGTHRLISKDVGFKDLGILIIDEEHRFGVKAKEKLRSFKANVDTLTLTATPIPRTLNFSLHGARDLSIIATPPPNRQPIYTKVELFDILKIREYLLFELNRKGQVYIVHDRIHSIDKFAAYITKYVPEVRIGIAHGQMSPNKLEEIIHNFQNRHFNVLLSTKIIESGIDIPNVNTIIINRADRFGLAELHQLRGRVGRSDRQAYAYFLVPSLEGLKKATLRRLKAIEEYTELGSGFSLSMRDLEIRGAGNLLGTEQSGFINDVGFDLYMKLVSEAVEELKRTEFANLFKDSENSTVQFETAVDTFFEIGIPPIFMPDQSDRLHFYTSLQNVKSLGELNEIREELRDRFGMLPIITQRLLAVSMLRLYAANSYFERVAITRKNAVLVLPGSSNEFFYTQYFTKLIKHISNNYQQRIEFVQQKENMKLVMKIDSDMPEKILSQLIDFCKDVISLYDSRKKNLIESENEVLV